MAEAILPLVHSLVGSAGEWEYLYDTIGKKVTRTMVDDKYLSYYKGNNWTRSKFDKATKGWVAAGKIVCGCQGVEDYYSKSDTSANNNYKKYCTDKGF